MNETAEQSLNALKDEYRRSIDRHNAAIERYKDTKQIIAMASFIAGSAVTGGLILFLTWFAK